MESRAESHEIGFGDFTILDDFRRLTGEEHKTKIDFIAESDNFKTMNIDGLINSSPEDILNMLGNEESDAVVLERLKLLGYWVAFKEIRQLGNSVWIGKGADEEFVEIQKRIDNVTLNWLNHLISTKGDIDETSDWAQTQLGVLQFDIAKRQEKKFTNLQVLRGSKCNVSCQFCFTQKAESENIDTKGHLADIADVDYNEEDFALQLLYARMAYGLNEILFTSYGDPLANEKKGDYVKNNPFISLNNEIQISKEIGFPHITILTNGTGFFSENTSNLNTEEKKRLEIDDTFRDLTEAEIIKLGKIRVDMLVDSGITNLTISLHTKSPDTWKKLVNPKTKASYEQLVEIVKYAGSIPNLTTRINVAYSTEVESADELISWARDELKIQELTLVEMIPGNKYAIDHKRVPPDDTEMEQYGFKAVGGQPWGLRIYKNLENNFSVAVCHFGQQDPSFSDQEKNLELILSGGRGEKGSMLVAGGLWDKKSLEWWKV